MPGPAGDTGRRRADRRARVALVLLGVGLLLGTRSAVAEGDSEARVTEWRRARAEAPVKLKALAKWAGDQKAEGVRVAALQHVLLLLPDDEETRKALHHVRGSDGRWVPSAARPPPIGPAGAPTERLRETLAPLKESARRVWEDAGVPHSLRDKALDDWVGADPDDEAAHEAAEEVRTPTGWVLKETIEARRRHAQLMQNAEDSALTASAELVGASPDEVQISGGKPEVLANADVRAVGASRTSEAREVAVSVTRVRAFYAKALRTDLPRVRGLRFFLFPSEEVGRAALDRDARITGPLRREANGLSSTWAPNSHDCYVWCNDAEERIDTSLRQAFGTYMRREFDVSGKHGWAFEGFGHFASEVVLSSHQSFFVSKSEYAGANQPKFSWHSLRTTANWLPDVADLAAAATWSDFRLLLGHDVNALTPDEYLVSYALARFLIEGREDVVQDVLRDVGKGVPLDKWVESRLDCSVDGLERRLRRWIREMRAN